MSYNGRIKAGLARKLRKLWKKDKVNYERVLKRIGEIKEDPNRYKHLRHDTRKISEGNFCVLLESYTF